MKPNRSKAKTEVITEALFDDHDRLVIPFEVLEQLGWIREDEARWIASEIYSPNWHSKCPELTNTDWGQLKKEASEAMKMDDFKKQSANKERGCYATPPTPKDKKLSKRQRARLKRAIPPILSGPGKAKKTREE